MESSLEAHQLIMIDKWTKRLIQEALKAQVMKKYGRERKFKKKYK